MQELQIPFRRLVMMTAIASLFTLTAAAQVHWGVRAGEYTDTSKPMVGVEAITPIARSLYFNPNVEWVLADGGDLATFNADVHYDFDTRSNVFAWFGGGLAAIYDNIHGSDNTDLGVNVLGGVGWDLDTVIPYVQIKRIISDDDEFVIAGGIRF